MHFYNLHQREKGGGKFNLSLGKNAIDILTIQLFVKQLETQVLETKKKISQTQDWAIKKNLKRFAFKRFSAFYLKAWPSSTSLDENLITHIAHLRRHFYLKSRCQEVAFYKISFLRKMKLSMLVKKMSSQVYFSQQHYCHQFTRQLNPIILSTGWTHE